MDAQAMVEMSRRWISVPPQQSCEVVSPYYYKVIPAMGYVTIELDVDECPGVNHLEHVSFTIAIWSILYFSDPKLHFLKPQL